MSGDRVRISIRGLRLDDVPVCEGILHSLPDWFGIEESVQEYVRALGVLAGFVAISEVPVPEPRIVGFVALRAHGEHASEIEVMAVRPDYHRAGVGRILLACAEVALPDEVSLLQVKTLGPSHPDPFYRRTRAFYEAQGFVPLEETTAFWGEANPTLVMVKALRPDEPDE